MMKRALVLAVCLGIMVVATASASYAQATRTWVSGVGDDVNPCSRTAPCKTFAGAISKTAAGGEINCLDPGGFGTITITKSLTIDCQGTLGSILSAGAPTGVTVNGTNIVVTLRNLSIQAVGTGTDGIRFVNGKQLNIENVNITQVARYGVWVSAMAGAGSVVIKNASITNGVDGIRVAWGHTMVSNSVIAEDSGVITADSDILTNNGFAVQAGNGGINQANASVRMTNDDVYNNGNGTICAGGTVSSNGTNRKGSNTGGGVAPCATIGVIQTF
jgi:hypothetical protein